MKKSAIRSAISLKTLFPVVGVLILMGCSKTDNSPANQEYTTEVNYEIPTIKKMGNFVNVVYIDPSYSGNELGTIEEPFNSWADIIILPNTAYLFKSGTTLTANVSIQSDNNYLGKYDTGARPIILGAVGISGAGLTIDSLEFQLSTNQSGNNIKIKSGSSYITIANSHIMGVGTPYNYPHRNIDAESGNNYTFYNNIISHSIDDGMYIGSTPNLVIVRNYMYMNNLGGLNSTTSTGDCIQLEYDNYDNAYIAGNWLNRTHTIWKFAFIINATKDQTDGVVCEWNTFIAPREGNGGAAVQWYGGANSIFAKNLIILPNGGVSGIASSDAIANMEAPYGVRDNHFYGTSSLAYGFVLDESNKSFASLNQYKSYLTENDVERYGSDIDTTDFWKFKPKR